MKKVILFAVILFALFWGHPLSAQASPLAFSTQRLAGHDRIGTALKIAQEGWTSAQTVILCEESDYADSIAATPYAVSLNAPILLTAGSALDPRVVAELQRLKPQKVILLGGSGCLQPTIEQELSRLSLKWERIGGADRYETSILLAQRLPGDSLILANGDNFPDALSAASFAGIKQIPIVLTSKTFPASVVKYYAQVHPQHLLVIGGEGAIPSAELAKYNFRVETRLGGQDRYDTNAQVVTYMQSAVQSNDLFLASGLTFPDAIAGTVLAAKLKAPLLLTESNDIPPAVYRLLRAHMKVAPPASAADSSGNPSANTSGNASGNTSGDTSGQTPHNPSGNTSNPDSGGNAALQGTINAAAGLNLRNAPSTTGKILGVIPQGTVVGLSARQGQWYETAYQGSTGWIFSSYVTLAGSSSSDSTPAQPGTEPSASGTANKINSAPGIDLSPNGTVYILGGPGAISLHAQNIIEGKASSAYPENLQASPPQITPPSPPAAGGTPPADPGAPVTPPVVTSPVVTPPVVTPPVVTPYDPSKEIPVDPFQGIPAQALSGKTIVVDPGHGGPDAGAVGPNHTYEKDNTLAIALALNTILKKAGAKVVLTRDSDVSPATPYSVMADLQARVDIANQSHADLFISIHNNSFTNPDVQGTATYFSSDNPKQNESLQLAHCIQTAVVNTIHTKDRGINDEAFYVIKHTTMPAVLLEVAFISNPYEEARLQNPIFRQNVAAGIFHGIYNYFKNPLPSD
ncbi:N-acetylmuramoyl-L-alanine amidase [Acididesulfobacillus acetoxydans]|uniref:N-acetylmuramoyl-L-alanine amidase n=1 Tax=Acididesulfobacillus acetoxydans TaxID=1561005 RepID=A0ABP1XGG4_9FIRM|nr:N-acetylmuramoyl-L-alanine amidase [Acididesulfobacillus acetoxydans]CEJ08037.1 N-acetylmuramoyl-L-alanine amidase [Acididesulfobacillus acetoxydans]